MKLNLLHWPGDKANKMYHIQLLLERKGSLTAGAMSLSYYILQHYCVEKYSIQKN